MPEVRKVLVQLFSALLTSCELLSTFPCHGCSNVHMPVPQENPPFSLPQFQDEMGFPSMEDDGPEEEERVAEPRPNFNTPQALR